MMANRIKNKFKLNVDSLFNNGTCKATNQLYSDISQALTIGERGRSPKRV